MQHVNLSFSHLRIIKITIETMQEFNIVWTSSLWLIMATKDYSIRCSNELESRIVIHDKIGVKVIYKYVFRGTSKRSASTISSYVMIDVTA